jgi:hypothetical protein
MSMTMIVFGTIPFIQRAGVVIFLVSCPCIFVYCDLFMKESELCLVLLDVADYADSNETL